MNGYQFFACLYVHTAENRDKSRADLQISYHSCSILRATIEVLLGNICCSIIIAIMGIFNNFKSVYIHNRITIALSSSNTIYNFSAIEHFLVHGGA